MTRKPTIPEVLDRFAAYHREHGWSGGLHSVLSDGNVRDCHVRDALERATSPEACSLLGLLLRMSTTQRLRLPDLVDSLEYPNHNDEGMVRKARLHTRARFPEQLRLPDVWRRERQPRVQHSLGGLPADPRLAFFRELRPETWPPPADVALAQPVYSWWTL